MVLKKNTVGKKSRKVRDSNRQLSERKTKKDQLFEMATSGKNNMDTKKCLLGAYHHAREQEDARSAFETELGDTDIN